MAVKTSFWILQALGRNKTKRKDPLLINLKALETMRFTPPTRGGGPLIAPATERVRPLATCLGCRFAPCCIRA